MNYEPLYTFAEKHRVPYNELCTALRAALAAPQPEPVAWKCAKCGNTSDCEGVTVGDNWCNSCAVCGEMKPLYATAPPAAPAPAVPEVMAGPMPPMSEADEKRLNAALTIVFDLACGPADPTMMQDELVAAAESIGMRFPAPAVPDDAALNTLAKLFHNGEEIEGDNGAAMMVDMALWHEASEAFDSLIGEGDDETLASSAAPAVPLTDEQFADIVAEASLAVDLAANPLKLLAFARAVLSAAPVVREPLTFEQRRAIQEAHCNDMAQAYFSARPQLNDKVERRIYEAGFNAGYGIGGGGK